MKNYSDYEIKKELLYNNYNSDYDYLSAEKLKLTEDTKDFDYVYRQKMEEPDLNQQSFSTPFSVKDILNINQNTHYQYDRNDSWKTPEDREKNYAYESQMMCHQAQAYPEYFAQIHPNSLPMHNMAEQYWPQEMYHEPKIDYYSSYSYCHNLYHPSYDQQYPNLPVHPPGLVDVLGEKLEVIQVDDHIPAMPQKQNSPVHEKAAVANVMCPSYPSSGSANRSPRKNTRKSNNFTILVLANYNHKSITNRDKT